MAFSHKESHQVNMLRNSSNDRPATAEAGAASSSLSNLFVADQFMDDRQPLPCGGDEVREQRAVSCV
jgi:hypothetical protein